MRILPVIDLLRGQVVRGVGGRRHEYQPVMSRLAADSSPAAIAAGLAELGLDDVYVADLDAIGGQPPDAAAYRAIAAAGLSPWIDAGIDSVARAEAVLCAAQLPSAVLIVGLETLPVPERLAQLAARYGEQLAFSLDLRAGQPLVCCDEWRNLKPLDIAAAAVQAGIRRLIVLDLADVGSGAGASTLDLCQAARRRFEPLHLVGGGGVRGPDDLHRLAAAGCDAALVASALHDGRLTRADVAAWNGAERRAQPAASRCATRSPR